MKLSELLTRPCAFVTKFVCLCMFGLGTMTLVAPAQAQSTAETVFWETVADSENPKMLRLYIQKFPDGVFVELAEIMLEDLEGDGVVSTPAAAAQPAVNTSAKAAPQASEKTQLEQAIAECDALAGSTYDPTLPVPSTGWNDLVNHAARAVAACDRATASGNPRHLYQFARASWASGVEVGVYDNFVSASAAGSQAATFTLAVIHQDGWLGKDVNYPRALKIFKELASLGHADANFQIGWMYLYSREQLGLDATTARTLAHRAISKAVRQGSHEAVYALGLMFEMGWHVGQDTTMAEAYYRDAIDLAPTNIDKAKERLSDMLLEEARTASTWEEFLYNENRIFEALELKKSEVNKRKIEQDAFVNGIINVADKATNYINYLTRQEMLGSGFEDRLADIRERALNYLDEALYERHLAFPDDYPRHTETMSISLMGDLKRTYANYSEEYVDWVEFLRYAQEFEKTGGGSDACLSKSSGFTNDDYFRADFKNRCKYPVMIVAELAVDYSSSSYRDIVEHKKFKILAGEADWIATPTNGATSNGSVRFTSCFARNGFKTVDWNSENFRCASNSHDNDVMIGWLNTQLDDFVKKVQKGW